MDDLIKVKAGTRVRVNNRISDKYAHEICIKVGDTGLLNYEGSLHGLNTYSVTLDGRKLRVALFPSEFDIIEDYVVEML